MNSSRFCKSFRFYHVTHRRVSRTDNSRGITDHFLARLLCGEGRIETADGETLHLRAGDVFYLPRGLRYCSIWTPGEGGTVEWDAARFSEFPAEEEGSFSLQCIKPSPRALGYLQAVEYSDKAPGLTSVGLFLAALGQLLPDMKKGSADPRARLWKRAQTYLEEHPRLRVPELARHCGMSESGLYAFFRSYAATTPVNEKNRILAGRALFLLRTTDEPSEAIAGSLGLQSAAYLNKLLRRHTGKSIAEHRRDREHRL